MKIEISAALLVNIIAQLSYQEGFIAGVGQALEKKYDANSIIMDGIHEDILNQFEKNGSGEA